MGDDRIARAFASGSWNGKNHAHLQRFGNGGFANVEIPEVALVQCPYCDGFGCVDHRTAAYGKQQIDLLFAAETDAFIHFHFGRIGLYASQLAIGYAGSLQRQFHPGKQTAPLDGASAIDYHHSGSTVLAHQATRLRFRVLPEYKLGRTVKHEIVHNCNKMVLVFSKEIIVQLCRLAFIYRTQNKRPAPGR